MYVPIVNSFLNHSNLLCELFKTAIQNNITFDNTETCECKLVFAKNCEIG